VSSKPRKTPPPEEADQVETPPEAAEDPDDDLQSDPERLKTELDQANDRVLRSQAELENYRKRVRREAEEERRYATMPLIRDLLAVVDNIDRAVEAAEDNDNDAGLLEGFKMVADQVNSILQQHHCTKIEADGAAFDPNLHEAILQQPSEDHPPGTVLHEAVVGYTLHERVVRPSQVIVSAAVHAEDETADS